ncbi:MAG: molybdenum cofactor biosynthesis protein MoaE [Thaumarchaeota archaeon]|nr:molybdenum cofactor biosynthesis protein MoaE [Nitrososphaerota archaeon]
MEQLKTLKAGVYPKGSADFISLYRMLLEGLPGDVGAFATFVGIVKNVGKDGKGVAQLEMQSYEEHANKVMQKICDETEKKYELNLVRIYHLIGEFDIGEGVVFVAAAGRSRDAVFAGLREAVERYKSEPALFKKELYVDGSHEWIRHA